VIAGGAVAATSIPYCSQWLIYDRPAILSGQIWRMFTGQWVHFSTRHLVYDLVAWCVAGIIIELRGLPCFGWFCFLTPWAVSTASLVFEPQMTLCGGLSGLAVAAFVYLSVGGLGDLPPWRWVWLAVLAGLSAKLIFEAAAGRSLLDTLDSTTVAVSVTSHAAGAATALMFYLISKPSRRSTTA
jgi:rhomboid family GlyGly-CTERM serine protease